jgi:hypothetical protein
MAVGDVLQLNNAAKRGAATRLHRSDTAEAEMALSFAVWWSCVLALFVFFCRHTWYTHTGKLCPRRVSGSRRWVAVPNATLSNCHVR